MAQMYRWSVWVFTLVSMLLLANCSGFSGSRGEPGAVILDIGHCMGAEGAMMPSELNGKRYSEAAFWYRFAPYTKRVIERAGYRCTICNRGYMPEEEPLRSYAKRGRVIHHRRPDLGGARRASRYHPDRVASGIISADYAVWRRAACMVFLHHNSSSRRWVRGSSPSVVLHNRYNGRALAQSIARRMERHVLNHGMDNKGVGCKVASRYVDASRGGGWLNACDDSGIPAAILEVAYLNNRNHAAYLVDDANARRYAEVVGQGIVDYLRRHGNSPRRVRPDKNQPDEGSFGYARESRSVEVSGAKRLLP